jgi:hypothetical protein
LRLQVAQVLASLKQILRKTLGLEFMRMTSAEIARLKEELTVDYKRKLEAIELVEQMLNQQQKGQSGTGSRNKVQPSKVSPSAHVSGGTIAVRVEQAFQKQPKWTIPALMSIVGAKNRTSVWAALNRLVRERKVSISRQAAGRGAVEYTRVP